VHKKSCKPLPKGKPFKTKEQLSGLYDQLYSLIRAKKCEEWKDLVLSQPFIFPDAILELLATCGLLPEPAELDLLKFVVEKAGVNLVAAGPLCNSWFTASQFGRISILEYLYSLGFDINCVDTTGITALHYALDGGGNIDSFKYCGPNGTTRSKLTSPCLRSTLLSGG